MQKSPEAFRTISEVAQMLDLPQHVLRFWEGKFPHIKPLKRAGGRRYYRPEDIALLRGIRALLYGEGYTIKGVQKVLRDAGARQVAEIGRVGLKRGRGGRLDDLLDAAGSAATEIDAPGGDEMPEALDAPDTDGEELQAGDLAEAQDEESLVQQDGDEEADDGETEDGDESGDGDGLNGEAAETPAGNGSGAPAALGPGALVAEQRARLESALEELLALKALLSRPNAKADAAE